MKTQLKWQLIMAVLLIVLGLLCCFVPLKAAAAGFWIADVFVLASALILWFDGIRKKSRPTLLEAVGCTLLFGLLLYGHLHDIEFLLYVFAIYMLGISVFLAVQVWLDWHEKAPFGGDLIHFLLYFGLGLFALLHGNDHFRTLMVCFGLYLLIQGGQFLAEALDFRHGGRASAILLRRWMSLPTAVVAVLPGMVLRGMLKSKFTKDPLAFDAKKSDEEPDVKVFIHTGLTGEHLIGHMTFSYKGVMYSYGNYDTADKKLFGTIGPGILFFVDGPEYVNNSCIYEKSVLYEYGLKLTEEQKKNLEEKLTALEPLLVEWESPLQQAGNVDENFPKYESDYASRLWYRTRCKFHTFKSGPWKTYWVVGDNCSLFAENMLSSAGCDVVHKTGVVSPGEYWEYFETEFADPKSNVISRKWHSAEYPETLCQTPNLASDLAQM